MNTVFLLGIVSLLVLAVGIDVVAMISWLRRWR
jgi:hypothetical protein